MNGILDSRYDNNDVFSFALNAGDTVDISLAPGAGTLDPDLDVFGPGAVDVYFSDPEGELLPVGHQFGVRPAEGGHRPAPTTCAHTSSRAAATTRSQSREPLPTPRGPSGTVTVNGGAAYTDSANVTLALSASDGTGSGVTQMQFSNDNTSWGTPVAYASSYAYTLPAGDGAKTVYVRFIDAAGNIGPAASDTITLNTPVPDKKVDHTASLAAPGDVVRSAGFTVSGYVRPLAAAGQDVVVTAYLNGIRETFGHGGQGETIETPRPARCIRGTRHA